MVEKPDKPVSRLAQVGLYYLKDGNKFMEYIQKAIDMDLRVKGEFYLPDIFKLMLQEGFKLGAPEIDEWLDCGKPETLLLTNRYLLQRYKDEIQKVENSVIIPPVHIHPTAMIKNSVIGPYVSIAEGCEIVSSIIRDSVVNPNSCLINSMLAESIVGDSAQFRGHTSRINIGDNSVIDFDNEKSLFVG
jgi:glucose-1-phosphate thymidylyltransferase